MQESLASNDLRVTRLFTSPASRERSARLRAGWGLHAQRLGWNPHLPIAL